MVVAGVQQQRARARSGDKPAFKLANKTSMNLDGPGYALTLLLVGGSHTPRHKAENITHFSRSNCHFGNGIYERAGWEHHHVKISGKAASSQASSCNDEYFQDGDMKLSTEVVGSVEDIINDGYQKVMDFFAS